MAPKQKKILPPIELPPPPPPPIKDDSSDFESDAESVDISPPPTQLKKPQFHTPPLKQQTLESSYNTAYKATIIKLIQEDPDIQETLANTILRLNCENPTIQDSIKHAILNIDWKDATIQSNIQNTVLKILREDIEVRELLSGITSQSKIRKSTTSKKCTEEIPQQPQQSPPQDNTNQPFEKRILTFLRKNLNNALTYEEFSNQVVITDTDLECILQKGFVEGFVTLILRNLANLELTRRPVHSFARDYSGVYIKISQTRWKRDIPPSYMKQENKRMAEGTIQPKWEHLSEMIFDFSQKVDIKIAELKDSSPPENWSLDEWNNRLDKIRKQASGGIERIPRISDICKQVVDGIFIEI